MSRKAIIWTAIIVLLIIIIGVVVYKMRPSVSDDETKDVPAVDEDGNVVVDDDDITDEDILNDTGSDING